MVLTALLTVSARSASRCLTTDSTLAIISVAGMFAGVTGKFTPLFSTDTSASLRDLDDKLMTQLVLSTKNAVIGETEACFSRGGTKDSLGVGSDLGEYLRCVLCGRSRFYALLPSSHLPWLSASVGSFPSDISWMLVQRRCLRL